MSPATARLAVRFRPNDGSGLVLQDRKAADAAIFHRINCD